MELVLVRHGATGRAEAEVGAADPGLTERGHAQARRLAAWIGRHEPVDHIVSSPLLRARQTAAPLSEVLGLEPEVLAELAEFDAGSSIYIPMEELRATRHPRLRAMAEGHWDELVTGVDPQAFRLTIVGTLDRLAQAHPGARVAVVCHGAVINAYLGDVIGTPRLLWFEPRYTSLNRVLVSRDGFRSVESLNELPHLQENP